MTVTQLEDLVEGVLEEVTFEPPISLTYCKAVREAILAKAKISAEVYSKKAELVVRVQDGLAVYQLALPTD